MTFPNPKYSFKVNYLGRISKKGIQNYSCRFLSRQFQSIWPVNFQSIGLWSDTVCCVFPNRFLMKITLTITLPSLEKICMDEKLVHRQFCVTWIEFNSSNRENDLNRGYKPVIKRNNLLVHCWHNFVAVKYWSINQSHAVPSEYQIDLFITHSCRNQCAQTVVIDFGLPSFHHPYFIFIIGRGKTKWKRKKGRKKKHKGKRKKKNNSRNSI